MQEILVKKALYETCQKNIEGRIQNIRERLQSIEESRNNETKSSVGDKYETGRAMMQMEEEKSQLQLLKANKVLSILSQINPEKITDKIETGSLVITNKGKYYFAIGIGKVKLDQQIYFCVSSDAPIAKIMRNKRVGDEVLFNGRKIVIKAIY